MKLTEDEIEDLQLEADELLEQGNIEEAESYYEEALALYNKALEIYKRIDYPKGIVESVHKIAVVYWRKGEFDKALQELDLALNLAEANQLYFVKAQIYNDHGNIYQKKGLHQQALAYFNKALTINKMVGNRFGEATNLGNLGIVYRHPGQYEVAIAHYKQALNIDKQI